MGVSMFLVEVGGVIFILASIRLISLLLITSVERHFDYLRGEFLIWTLCGWVTFLIGAFIQFGVLKWL